FSAHAGVVRVESVAVVALDGYDVGAAQAVFLKIDTQGYEREVLAGAGTLLKRCVGLQLELPIEHLYKDVWSFNEALAFVDNLGFVPAQIRMVNALHDDKASALEFDVIFRRKR
ncbi:MAG: FkbM family methyltransferase, partial [Rhodospirillaceae bacterium]|nr:FkbM family methyltransferase [Rhodospirillaceae bacterium]